MKSLPGSLDRLFWLGVFCKAKQEPVGRSALLVTHLAAASSPDPCGGATQVGSPDPLSKSCSSRCRCFYQQSSDALLNPQA